MSYAYFVKKLTKFVHMSSDIWKTRRYNYPKQRAGFSSIENIYEIVRIKSVEFVTRLTEIGLIREFH